MYKEYDSLTIRHKITLDRLTRHCIKFYFWIIESTSIVSLLS